MRHRLLPVAALAGLTGLVAGALPANADTARPHIVVKDGKTQPVFSFKDAVREKVFVETTVDSDGDGKRDRVSIYVTRPKETDGGLKVASIIEGSPYYAGLQDPPYHPADVTDYPRLAKWTPPPGPPGPANYAFPYYDNYFVSRGYAFIAADTLGTGDSDGCPTAVGPNEAQGMKSVIEWLAGKGTAYDENGKKVRAGWSTGNVAMAGKSYDGTLPLAAAATRVPALKTVVSVSGVSNWYDEYRANGGVVAPDGWEGEDLDLHAKAVLSRKDPAVCAPVMHDLEKKMDRVTGDYNATWDARNFAKSAPKFRASVFLTSGLADWNVKPIQMSQLWDGLKKAGVDRKLWIHQGAHDDPLDIRQSAWLETLNLWFAHELYNVRNDIMRQPRVDLERTPGNWETHREWPDPSARPVSLGLNAKGLGTRGNGTQQLVDDPSRKAEDLAAKPDEADPNRLIYLTPALTKATKLSGTASVKLRASVDGRSPYLSAVLVDYGTDERVSGFVPTSDRWCYGDSIPGNEGCRAVRKYTTAVTPFKIVTRGWLDVRNRTSIWRSTPVKAGKDYTFSWTMQPYDYVFKPGHRIGLMVLATDHAYTLRYPAGTKVKVDLHNSTLTLPLH
ncbi:Xaa-Pro dipeptidyl-peptidase [Actinomadura chibensis]|uniref:Xaa-Pro dipeptidyl-peptidase n=1 Tax=Actinomadura chibensis TaxID=392828 RepID=A0A5D0NVL4_9ACTN|nr:Xaa-Pro dipeptidyl-peptidase [Actinomadura chibensis]TYB48437.1 Xaa-Pro dipeptidyl-peptidase [Actinomadura chibensis]